MADENVVYVGNKPVMNYVLACVTQINRGANEIIVKARGRAISRAVDVAEILRNRFLLGKIDVSDIKIMTERINRAEGGVANVSAIEITLSGGEETE